MIACISFGVDRQVDALDDLGAVLEGDVQILEFEQCQGS